MPVVMISAPDPVIILFAAVLLALSLATVIFCAVELNKYSILPFGLPQASEDTPVMVNAEVGPVMRTNEEAEGPILLLAPFAAV